MAKKSDKKGKGGSSVLKGVLIALLIGLGCVVTAYLINYVPFTTRVELMSLDFRYKSRKPIDLYPNLGYVNLDTESCELAGDWPWPRNYHVALVETLGFYGARAAGYDVFYTEPSPINQRPAPELEEGMDEDVLIGKLQEMFVVHDENFEQALEKSGVIYLGEFLSKPNQVGLDEDASDEEIDSYISDKKENEKLDTSRYAAKLENLKAAQVDAFPTPEGWKGHVERMVDISVPIASLSRASQGIGFEQIIPDNITGTVYEYPMLLEYDGWVYPALGLLMAADMLGIDISKGKLVPNEYLELEVTKGHGEIQPGPIRIPVNEKIRSLMNWSGPYFDTYFHINFRQLSRYHAMTQVKAMVRDMEPSLVLDHSKAKGQLMEKIVKENWVEEEEGLVLADEILLAQRVAVTSEKDRSALIQSLVSSTGAPLERVERVVDGVRLSLHLREVATDEDRQMVADEISTHAYLNFREGLWNDADYPSIDVKHAKEIARNLLFFDHEGRSEVASPPYFAPCAHAHVYGEVRDISPTMLKNKVLMIGLEGEGTIDLNPQPYEESCAMVALHANAINTFLTSQYLHFPKESTMIFWLVVLTLIMALLAQFLSTRLSFLAYAVILVGYGYYCWNEFSSKGQDLNSVVPALGLTLSYLFSEGLQLYLAFKEKQKMKGMFGKMVSPDVLQVMSDNPDLFSLSGRRQSCTSYFSSMEGFHHISKGVTPQELTGLLGSYLTPASQIITSYKGYIDKYEGHIIMADYGVPIPTGNHRIQCLFASIECQLDMKAFEHFIYARKGKKVNTSMGVNTGFVSAGNMGSDKKMQYTIMGDTVNTAARFRPANWMYDYLGSIIIGEMTYPFAKDFVQLRPLDRLLLKGKLKPVNTFQVMGWKPEAYMEHRAGADVRENLEVCWAKHCPPEKIYGYELFFRHQAQRTGQGLCDEIADFFASQNEICAELTKITVFMEVRDNALTYGELQPRFEAITSHAMETIPSGEWKEKLHTWADHLKAHLKELEDDHHGNPEADKLHRDLLVVFEKVETQADRMENDPDLPPFLQKVWDEVRSFTGTDLSFDEKDYAGEYEEVYVKYEEAALAFVETVLARSEEYHVMMSIIGSMTEAEQRAVENYTRGLELHWEREWDDSVQKFQEVLVDLPEDKPSVEFLRRLENYKAKPPEADWQGEFKQTKK